MGAGKALEPTRRAEPQPRNLKSKKPGPMPNPVFSSLPTSIFQHMTMLALKHEAINLGQGFPDQDGPLSLREVAAKQLLEGPNQYPPSKGMAILRQAVAAHAAKFYGLSYDPEDEVVITSGGTEA